MSSATICIPIRDEAAELPGLFAALDNLDCGLSGPVHICLLLDGCTDRSPVLADAYRRVSAHRVSIGEVAASASNAGAARRRAMAMGLHGSLSDDGVLLTTDADSRPARSWLIGMQSALRHADVVTGRIIRSGKGGVNPLQDRIEGYYDALFTLRRQLDPVPWEADTTHHYTGGANMGFRAGAYRALGGFLPLPSGEDAQLIDDAGRAGLKVRRDAACVVHTSDRREGRATGGLAMALRRCDESDAASTYVAHPHDAAWQYRLHALTRAAFADDRWDIVGDAIGLSPDHVLGVARDCPNAEAFAMRIVPVPPGGVRTVTLARAEAEIALLCDRAEAA